MKQNVYTAGTFDLLHSGHFNLIRAARRFLGAAGRLVVGLNTDEFVLKYKGALPVQEYKEREQALYACGYVNDVTPNNAVRSLDNIIKAQPGVLVIGSDWAGRDYYAQMGFTHDWLDEHGIALVYVPYTRGISTTILKERIKECDSQ